MADSVLQRIVSLPIILIVAAVCVIIVDALYLRNPAGIETPFMPIVGLLLIAAIAIGIIQYLRNG